MADRITSNTVTVFSQEGARLFYLAGEACKMVSERCLGSNKMTRTNWTLINFGPSLPWYARNGCTREISREFETRTQALQFAAHWQVAEEHAARGFARIRRMMTADQFHLV
ncbi:MAG: hypothetical protein ACXW35_09600 [Nitrospira sp.]